MSARPSASIVVMGVQGVGKSTIGAMLAARLGVAFVDGDALHPARNVELMASGMPLSDDDRVPWLAAIGSTVVDRASDGGVVVACSALRRSYRDLLREHDPLIYFVEPWGPIELVRERIGARTHEYMPPALLQSQYDTLEPLAADENGIRVSVRASPEEIVAEVVSDRRAQKGAQG